MASMKKIFISFAKRSLAVMAALFMAMPVAMMAQAQSEKQVNNEYHDAIISYLKDEMQKKEKQLNKQARQMLASLPNEFKLYDENFINIRLGVAEGLREDGSTEYNMTYSISYTCSNIEGVTDDYPLGQYHWDESNSSRAICNLTRNIVEGSCKEYFQNNNPVTIRIFSATDVVDITHVPYKAEYGDFRYVPVTYNGEKVRISVSEAEGISTNAQLAYIRAQSIRDFIETNITMLRRDDNNYEYITTNYEREGGQYRRCSIEMIVHGAFDAVAERMTTQLRDDEFVDFNIPEVEPASNKNTYALIFANEEYPAPIPAVPFADNDGRVLATYCQKTLGIPERHIKLFENASREQIRDEAIQWVKDITVAMKGDANIIIYYAGHGILSSDMKPYIIPCDVDAGRLKSINGKVAIGSEEIILSKSEMKKLLPQCISIDSICLWFNKVQFKSVTFIIDASFDGMQRSGQPFMAAVSGVANKRMKALRIRNDILVLQSSDFNKTSYSFDAQHHGFFTYFILKELRSSKGSVTVRDLFDNVYSAIGYESSLQGKLQQPVVVPGGKLKDGWGDQPLR